MRSNEESRSKGSGGQGAEPTKGSRGRGNERSFWRELPVLVLLALGLALLIRTFLLQAFYIPSESMERTLLPGDRVLVNKLSYRLGDIQRGDVIVFNGADSWESEIIVPEPSGVVERTLQKVGELFGFATVGEKDFIKRVIGLPGDRVECCDEKDRLLINGTPLEESSYIHPGDVPSQDPFDIKVPPGRVWVMGDHRSESADSRAHLSDPGNGTIPIDKVLGRAFVIVWPLDRLTLLNRPEAYAEAGLAAPAEPRMGPAEEGAGAVAALAGLAMGPAPIFAAAAVVVFPLAGLRHAVRRRLGPDRLDHGRWGRRRLGHGRLGGGRLGHDRLARDRLAHERRAHGCRNHRSHAHGGCRARRRGRWPWRDTSDRP